MSPLRTYLAPEPNVLRPNQISQPAAANVLSRQDPGSKLHKKSASGSYEKLPRSPQILRQRWIIFGEFVVSFTSTHFRTLMLSN